MRAHSKSKTGVLLLGTRFANRWRARNPLNRHNTRYSVHCHCLKAPSSFSYSSRAAITSREDATRKQLRSEGMKSNSDFKSKITYFLSQVKPSIPSSLAAEYKNMQLTHNIRRFTVTCVVLFLFNLISLLVNISLKASLNVKPIISNQLISILFLAVSGVYFIIFFCLKRYSDSDKLRWFLCYLFILIVCAIQFLKIINVTINMQPTFPFIILINLLIVVPDFKPIYTIFYILLVYAGTMLVQLLFLPVSVFAVNKIMNVTTFTIICIFTSLFLYTRNVQVYLNTVKLKEMNEHLSLLSTTDELTGLPNRRSFNYFYENIWSHCQRLKLPLCVIMIDIDYFKRYNDVYGHAEGDKILKTVAGHLSHCIKRDTDFIARYGGEEFVGILPYVEPEEAHAFVREIQTSIEALGIPAPYPPHSPLTISIGAALVIPKAALTKNALLESADKALYEAKNSGRNRVIFYNLEQAPH